MIRTKRIYEPPANGDGCRVLIDRIWPRGMSKQQAEIAHWLKDAAPSSTLRKWFDHDQKKWRMFVMRYRSELRQRTAALRRLRELVRQHDTVTLLYAARDVQHNNAIALQRILRT